MRFQALMKSGSLPCSLTTHWYARFLKSSSSSKRFLDSWSVAQMWSKEARRNQTATSATTRLTL